MHHFQVLGVIPPNKKKLWITVEEFATLVLRNYYFGVRNSPKEKDLSHKILVRPAPIIPQLPSQSVLFLCPEVDYEFIV